MITVASGESNNFDLEALLDLHGVTAEVGGGFWVSMKARKVPPDEGRPHGIQYALTLHRPGSDRIMGYDNAHALDIGSGPSRQSRRNALAYDHRHYRRTITAYDFVSPVRLLEDFWADVERLLTEESVK
jgi:hypothetical protein